MSSPIDPIRRSARLRRMRQAAERVEEAAQAERAGLPAPAGAPYTPPSEPAGGAAFDAQLMGQSGEKRGLRGGAPVIDSAQANYNRVEWSGSKDRRARKGRIADTEI